VHALERRSAATKAVSTNEIFLIDGSASDPNQQCMGISMVQAGDNFWPVSDGTSPSSDNTLNSLSTTTSSSPDSYLNDINGLNQVFFGRSPAVCTVHMLTGGTDKTWRRRSTT
jgi:hypothetical protein